MSETNDTSTDKSGFNPDAIIRWFAYSHLPLHLHGVVIAYADLAEDVYDSLPPCPERSVALRKLLESKDAAVRAAVRRHEIEQGSR